MTALRVIMAVQRLGSTPKEAADLAVYASSTCCPIPFTGLAEKIVMPDSAGDLRPPSCPEGGEDLAALVCAACCP